MLMDKKLESLQIWNHLYAPSVHSWGPERENGSKLMWLLMWTVWNWAVLFKVKFRKNQPKFWKSQHVQSRRNCFFPPYWIFLTRIKQHLGLLFSPDWTNTAISRGQNHDRRSSHHNAENRRVTPLCPVPLCFPSLPDVISIIDIFWMEMNVFCCDGAEAEWNAEDCASPGLFHLHTPSSASFFQLLLSLF